MGEHWNKTCRTGESPKVVSYSRARSNEHLIGIVILG